MMHLYSVIMCVGGGGGWGGGGGGGGLESWIITRTGQLKDRPIQNTFFI